MTIAERAPHVTCDCCGAHAEMTRLYGEKTWKAPGRWGTVKIPPAHWGQYPDRIDFADACPECIKVIHAAVSAAIDKRKKDASHE